MYKTAMITVLTIATMATAASAAGPQVSGQVRPRLEFRDTGGADDSFTSMRVRVNLASELEGGISTFVQIQDVRIWGEETSTLGDFRADNFDLHQGYVDFRDPGGLPAVVRLGRQEISLGGQRLVGAVGWTQQGRAFDGVRATLRLGPGNVDVLGLRLTDATAATAARNAYLAGAQARLEDLHGLEALALYNSDGSATDQVTVGLRQAGTAAGLAYRVEGAYQTGERAGEDVSAHMVGVRIGGDLADGKAKAMLWYDRLSGDDDVTDGETRVFDTLFATNHKFYGYADLFLNVPVHTAGRGLQDVAIKLSHACRPGWKVALDLHSFAVAAGDGLDSARLGEEVDLAVKYSYAPSAAWTGGLSYVRAADGFEEIGRLTDNVLFAYVLADVRF